ncbi:MAG: hypothetical protein HKM89_02755 [Gemmatimonadales bacterium]|nr:hypothetical protein [Gemmatimonadales bacterium]
MRLIPRLGPYGCLVGFLALLSCTPPAYSTQSPTGIDRAGWLSGCWERGSGDRTIEEQWMAPRGDAMVGMSRSVRDGRLVGYELVLIRGDTTGLVYEAHPSGQESAQFPAILVSDTALVFEDLEHDFPQRIGYDGVGADSLIGWIEGERGGELRRIDFPYRRVSCPSER